METFAQKLVGFVTGLERQLHCQQFAGIYTHTVVVVEPQEPRFGSVTFERTGPRPDLYRRVEITFDSSGTIRYAQDGYRNDTVCGISVVSDLIGSITTLLTEVEMNFTIVELSGDLVRIEVTAAQRCMCTPERNIVQVAHITANQRRNLITEFQSLI